MSERPSWLRADLLVLAAVVVAFGIAAVSPRWRAGLTGAIGGAGATGDITAGVDRSKLLKVDRIKPQQGELERRAMGRTPARR